MPDLDTDAIRAALAAATPGPWERGHADVYSGPDENDVLVADAGLSDHPVADAHLIVLLRNNAEALLDEVERLRERAR